MTNSKAGSIFDDLFDREGADLIRDSSGAKSRASVLGYSRRVAAGLHGCDLAPGDRVAILCASPTEAIIGFLAVLLTPFCAVPVHPASPAAAVKHVLADSGAKAIITDCAKSDWQSQADGLTQISIADFPEGREMVSQGVEPDADKLAVILYTSGTTGAPKGVTISVRNMESMADQLVNDFFRLDQTDTLLMSAPLANIFGIALILVALRARATLSIPSSLQPPELLETLTRDHVTFIAGVPMIGSLLLRAAQEIENPLPRLRRVLMAGTRLEPTLGRAFADKFNAEVMTGYAMTESVPISMALDLTNLPENSVGTIARDIELRIINFNMESVSVGEKGEILIRGPSVTPGYWQSEELNAQSFHKGWFRTGDVGKIDSSGHLVLIDRIKEIIKTAGNTVYPSEVEAVLKKHPSVQNAAVIGKHHKSLGEVVVAYFVLQEGQTVDINDLKAFCSERLISWKVPRKYISVDALPMTQSGKISKAILRSA